MKVYVRLLSNKRILFDVDEFSTIGSLKSEIVYKIPMENEFELVFDGIILENEKTLGECRLTDNDTIVLEY